jgi:hypothetical protein
MNPLYVGVVAVGLACVTGAATAAAPDWVVWQEPNERAFTMLVPKGWKVTGGLYRPNPLAYVTAIEMTSPDGQITTFGGNPFPAFRERNWMDDMSGLREGHEATDNWGIRWKLSKYHPGEQFLTKFVLPTRGQVRVMSARKVTAIQQPPFPGIMQSLDAGEVEYRVRRPGRAEELQGGALAVTQFTGNDLTRVWTIDRVLLYEAPEARIEEAKRVVLRATLTVRENPIWAQAQIRGQQDRMRIVRQTQDHVGQVLRDSYWSWQESRARIFKMTSDTIRGTVDLYDAQLGQVHYQQTDNSKHYWINRQGTIVGTDLDEPPSRREEWRPMQKLP